MIHRCLLDKIKTVNFWAIWCENVNLKSTDEMKEIVIERISWAPTITNEKIVCESSKFFIAYTGILIAVNKALPSPNIPHLSNHDPYHQICKMIPLSLGPLNDHFALISLGISFLVQQFHPPIMHTYSQCSHSYQTHDSFLCACFLPFHATFFNINTTPHSSIITTIPLQHSMFLPPPPLSIMPQLTTLQYSQHQQPLPYQHVQWPKGW